MQTHAMIATKKITVPQPGEPGREFTTGQVVNMIVWDGEADFEPGPNIRLEKVPEGWGVLEDGTLGDLSPSAG
jgi:hypothetical protein